MKIVKCEQCGAEFNAKNQKAKYCCVECRDRFYFNKKQKMLLEGVEGVDYVIDKWNGYATPRIYGKWMKNMHPDRTLDEYKNEFPEAPLYCSKDHDNISKNSGKHMKEEKYKNMFSEKFKGENNPNHKSRTTEEERKSRSPFSKEFYITRGIDDSVRSDFIKNVSKNRILPTQIEYYINQGMSEEDAKISLSERQRTFTLDKCIDKYGKEKGTEIFNNRQKEWSSKIEEKYINGDFSRIPYKLGKSLTSEEEKEFINNIVKSLNLNIDDCYAFESKKNQLRISESDKDVYFYDFCYNNKIIEFNGDFWHYNPKKYKSDSYYDIIGISAKEKWKRDSDKINCAKNNGYDILVIWESDYLDDKDSVIKRCVDFLCEG